MFLYYIKQIDSMCAFVLLNPIFDVICDLLLNRCMATWNQLLIIVCLVFSSQMIRQ